MEKNEENIDLIDADKEILELEDKLNSDEKNKNKKEEEIMYRLIYLYKIKKNFTKEKKYIDLCLKKDIVLSEEIWLDYINIIKQEKNEDSINDVINIYLKALTDFNYPKIIVDFFQFILNNNLIDEKYQIYYDKYLSKGIYSPEYSLNIFDLYYQFYEKIFELKKEKNIKQNIDKKLNNECNLNKYEIKQIFKNYKNYKKNGGNRLCFLFSSSINEEKDEEDEDIEMSDNSEEIKNNIILKITEFNAQFNLLFNESFENSNLISNHIESNINLFLKLNEKYILFYFEKALSKYINNIFLWKNYIFMLDNINSKSISKLEILKTAIKCCKKSGEFIIDYLYELEKNNTKNIENIINEYIINPLYSKKIEDLYLYLIQYKIRNFKNEMKDDEIKTIRNLFQKCISSIQNYNINEFTTRILHMWAEFEVYKTKDKNMFFNLMKQICLKLDKSINSFRAFIYYSKSFPNNESQIRQVYKLSYDNLESEEKLQIYNSWLQWELFFGDINSITSIKQLNNEGNNIIINEEKNEENKKVFIKGISPDIKEEELKEYINKKTPFIEYQNLRLVLDINGNNKGFAFVDFYTEKEAQKFIDIMNNNNDNIKLKNSELICAFCLSPKSGKNDKRTLFINNLPFNVKKEDICKIFEKFGKILDIRIIINPHTQKPRGYAYVEFEDEYIVDKVLDSNQTFVINDRNIIVSKSISVEKLRNAVKYVAHISNLNFKIKEKDIKELISKEIDIEKNLKKIFLCKDDDGKFKGYGFIEFNNKESLDKLLKLDGKVFKGRNLVIKESTRNITEKSENNQKFIGKKRKKSKNVEESEKSEISNDKNNINISENNKAKNKKIKMNNSDFKKLFS